MVKARDGALKLRYTRVIFVTANSHGSCYPPCVRSTAFHISARQWLSTQSMLVFRYNYFTR